VSYTHGVLHHKPGLVKLCKPQGQFSANSVFLRWACPLAIIWCSGVSILSPGLSSVQYVVLLVGFLINWFSYIAPETLRMCSTIVNEWVWGKRYCRYNQDIMSCKRWKESLWLRERKRGNSNNSGPQPKTHWIQQAVDKTCARLDAHLCTLQREMGRTDLHNERRENTDKTGLMVRKRKWKSPWEAFEGWSHDRKKKNDTVLQEDKYCKQLGWIGSGVGTRYPEPAICMDEKKMFSSVHRPFSGAVWQAALLVEMELPRTVLSKSFYPVCALWSWEHRAEFTCRNPNSNSREKGDRLAYF